MNLHIIETVDSIKLADTLNKECSKMQERQGKDPLNILVQVLFEDAEGSKHGLNP